jgi:Family of unknown function (DUF6191)
MTQWGLDTLFNPAKRHMDEEKRRLQSTREEIGDSSGGKRIDLESGKVTIRKSEPTNDTDHEDAADSGEVAGTDEPAATTEAAAMAESEPKAEPSPAAVRAAKRRGRQPR